MFSTVLFSSIVSEGGQPERFRLFGRAELPFHEAYDESWDGPGWFGIPQIRGQFGRRAISAWGDATSSIAEKALLDRNENDGTGTSILVLGFFEPSQEQPRSLTMIAGELLEATSYWFWPCLEPVVSPQLEVSAVVIEDGDEKFRQRAEVTTQVRPFVRAATAQPLVRLAEPDDVIERDLGIKVPRRVGAEPASATNARVRARLRLAKVGEDTDPYTVALVRGSGMVVKYYRGRRPISERRYHGVVLAGSAAGDLPMDRSVEMFLRSAEPPSHNDWKSSTERLSAEYPRGAKTSIEALYSAIDGFVADALGEIRESTDQGATELAKLFPLPGDSPGPPPPDKFRLDDLDASFENGMWHFTGSVRVVAQGGGKWQFRVIPELDTDSGKRDRLELAEFNVDGADVSRSHDGIWCLVPPDTARVYFLGRTHPQSAVLSPNDVRRTRLRLRVIAETLD